MSTNESNNEVDLTAVANPLALVNQTFAGFRSVFYFTYKRYPTDQEVFDAGVRAGLERADMQIRAALA